MDTAEWIIVSILSLTLFVFLILGIYVLTKVLDLTHDIKHVVRQVDSITKQGKKSWARPKAQSIPSNPM